MKIIFICHGNICRSVTAEVIAKDIINKKHIKDIEVISRALSNEEYGNDIYPPMKKVLLENGYKPERHFARKMSSDEARDADIIYYMDESNLRLLEWYFPNYLDKCHLITEKCGGLFISDPWYTGKFLIAYTEIKEAVEAILPK